MNQVSKQAKPAKILVVEDDLSLREALVDTLQLADFDVLNAPCAEDAILVVKKNTDIDLIVSDVNMGAMSGHDLLKTVKAEYPQIPVLLITAYASIQESVVAMKEGAVDYLVKPFEPDMLVETVKKFICHSEYEIDRPIAVSEASQQLLTLACRVAQSDSTVLLSGESGTGKEVLAKYIHANSSRSNKPFVAINCAAIPENMLEAILFGYEKGAYTGALTSSPGKFEQANGGTILLDEISEMELGLQAKLLRVLQEREVERLGSRKSIQLDVRVIATSNREMRREVSEGKFREDLYFRLSVLPLQWPPLRDRKEDIIPLATSLLERHAKKQRRASVKLGNNTKTMLVDYLWPGNVRELDNVMQRALILQPGNIIEPADLGLHIEDSYSEKPSLMDSVKQETKNQIFDMVSDVAAQSSAVQSTQVDECVEEQDDGLDLDDSTSARLGKDMRKHEFEIIVKTLKQENGSKKNTAKRLGISPRTLRYKIARLRDEGFSLESAMSFSY